jgi:hypothetical protein
LFKNDRSQPEHSDWTVSGYQYEPAPLAHPQIGVFQRNLFRRYCPLDLVKYLNRYLGTVGIEIAIVPLP